MLLCVEASSRPAQTESMRYYKRLFLPRVWRKVFYERLTEPIHLNILSLFVLALGSFRSKVEFDRKRHLGYRVRLRAPDPEFPSLRLTRLTRFVPLLRQKFADLIGGH
jgi:hypothetical protein